MHVSVTAALPNCESKDANNIAQSTGRQMRQDSTACLFKMFKQLRPQPIFMINCKALQMSVRKARFFIVLILLELSDDYGACKLVNSTGSSCSTAERGTRLSARLQAGRMALLHAACCMPAAV